MNWFRLFGYALLFTPVVFWLSAGEQAAHSVFNAIITSFVLSLFLSGALTLYLHKRQEARATVRERSMNATLQGNTKKKPKGETGCSDYTTTFNATSAGLKGSAWDA